MQRVQVAGINCIRRVEKKHGGMGEDSAKTGESEARRMLEIFGSAGATRSDVTRGSGASPLMA